MNRDFSNNLYFQTGMDISYNLSVKDDIVYENVEDYYLNNIGTFYYPITKY